MDDSQFDDRRVVHSYEIFITLWGASFVKQFISTSRVQEFVMSSCSQAVILSVRALVCCCSSLDIVESNPHLQSFEVCLACCGALTSNSDRLFTSSTAQGGGGSFKNRKPIGELGCCESGMAERSHWWTERCLRSPLFLSLSLTIYLPTYLSSMYLSIYPSIYLSLSFSLSLYLYLSIYLSLSLSFICLSV